MEGENSSETLIAFYHTNIVMPVTVAEPSKPWTVFARADAGTVGSNPTQGMNVQCLGCVFVFMCLYTGRGLATSWSPVQGVLPTVLDLVTEVKRKVSWRRPRPELGCRAKGKKILSHPRRQKSSDCSNLMLIISAVEFPRKSHFDCADNFCDLYPEWLQYKSRPRHLLSWMRLFLQENACILPEIKPLPLLSVSFLIHYSPSSNHLALHT
jgi:hypothetical protein